ncbi:MAG: hypothetical protein AAGA23_12925 [Pseudomonadota bacterium]
MDDQLVQEFVRCEAGKRRCFSYFKGRYALLLLKYALGDGCAIAELRKTPFQSLLKKPAVKPALQWAGDGRLTPDLLDFSWQEPALDFVVSFSQFSGWCQTSRTGANLVIQLNFSKSAQRAYERALRPVEHAALQGWGHPVDRWSRETLAWVRVDLDLDDEEALIEEIQCDWLRVVDNLLVAHRNDPKDAAVWSQLRTTVGALRRYHQALKPYRQIWAEAALAAALDYLLGDLGIRRVFYHQFETGCRLKGIDWRDAPPRSLYTELPRRFCMQATDSGPQFLMRQRGIRRRLAGAEAPTFFQLTPSLSG